MFIVVESIVGGGKKLYKDIAKKLRIDGYKVIDQDFPDRAGLLFEDVIYPTIHEGVTKSPNQRFLAFLLDQVAHTERINVFRKKGYVITESYFTGTIAYQVLYEKAMSVKDALKVASLVKLPIPDLSIYIDTPYEKAKRERELEGYGDKEDYWGSSIKKLKSIDINYKKMIEQNIFCPWEVVDGKKSKKEIVGDILDIIQKKFQREV